VRDVARPEGVLSRTEYCPFVSAALAFTRASEPKNQRGSPAAVAVFVGALVSGALK
jgi:hypothetical protein